LTGAPIVPIGLYGSEKLLPTNQDGDMSAESFNFADVHIKIGQQFDFPQNKEGLDKKEYEEYATNYLMEKIAELLPENYRGGYINKQQY